MASTSEVASVPLETDGELTYVAYNSERFLQGIMDLIRVDLSEPYSIFTYRYFINNWPNLCFLALAPPENSPESTADAAKADATPRVLGTIVCKQDRHRSGTVRGYIAMLAVHNSVRKRGMGRKLVQLAVRAMRDGGCDEAVLETEVTNLGALRLYEGLGFVRDKRLHRYYLNGNDAHRLKGAYPAPPRLADLPHTTPFCTMSSLARGYLHSFSLLTHRRLRTCAQSGSATLQDPWKRRTNRKRQTRRPPTAILAPMTSRGPHQRAHHRMSRSV
jgi:peptide alpha-N-acetyltransferase